MKAIVGLGVILLVCYVNAGSYTFDLNGRTQQCINEELVASVSSSKFMFRFAMVEPEVHDHMDVSVTSPSGIVIKTFDATKNGFMTETVRENGLYQFCYESSTVGHSSKREVFFDIEFITTGTRVLTNYPTQCLTVAKDSRSNSAEHVTLEMSMGKTAGVLYFPIDDLSTSVIGANTRASIMLFTEYAAVHAKIAAYVVDQKSFPSTVTWDTLQRFFEDSKSHSRLGESTLRTGQSIEFNVTERVHEALNNGDEGFGVVLVSTTESDCKFSSLETSRIQHWPILAIEDSGLHTMVEVARFKERVFELRAEIQFCLHQERYNRDMSESTNSRVLWMSVLTNLTLIGISVGQVLFVKHMLNYY